jgi:hypothetical protein
MHTHKLKIKTHTHTHTLTHTPLQLGCNHIGDEGVKALALALLSNAHESALVWLGLGGNEITDRGAEHIAVALKAQHMTNGHLLTADGEEGTRIIIEKATLYR